MIPKSQVRTKKNSSKVNLIISGVFHAVLVGALFYFAAREGLLGKKIQTLTVTTIKEKPPEKPKEPEKPKVEPPKEVPKEQAKAEAPKEVPQAAPSAAPAVAPANADLPSIDFNDGAHMVDTSSDPVQLYKSQIEYALRSKWNRPDNMADDNYAAMVNVAVGRDGTVTDPQWQSGSGDQRWDDSVKQVFTSDTTLSRPPPTNFPARVDVRFDVKEETEPVVTP